MRSIVRLVAYFLLIFALAETAARAAGPFGTIHVGTWIGGAYTDDNTGAFSHCSALSSYGNGTNVVLGQNASSNWLLGFANQGFHLTSGETFQLDVTLDGQPALRLFGTAFTPQFVVSILPAQAAQQLRKSSLMVAVVKGATFQFNLTSISALLPAIANCVAKTRADGVANAGDFTAPPPKPPAAKPAVAAAPAPSKNVSKSGTGFVVSANGHVLTNQHVIEGCSGEIHGNLSGEAPVVLRVVSTDETNDLALLQGSASSFKEVAMIREKSIHPGDSVVAIGYPFHGLLTSDFTVTTGIVSTLSGILNDTRYLQISAAVQPGNSGGPLLDSSGHIVGMVAAKLNALKFVKATGNIPENINFAIKTGALRDFLDNSVVAYQTAGDKAEIKTTDVAHDARAYTLLITCVATEQAEVARK